MLVLAGAKKNAKPAVLEPRKAYNICKFKGLSVDRYPTLVHTM
jgi:hypothetical protein